MNSPIRGALKDSPLLDGDVLTDTASRSAVARDFGGIIHRLPGAVIRPRSADDVVAVVRMACTSGMTVAARGRGHSTYGQSQADGFVLDMSAIAAIRELGSDSVLVGGGCTWATLVEATAAKNLSPPALTDYLHLSVGATLSFGGIGGASFRFGTQSDHVLELEVVTGAGDLVRCGPRENVELFDAVRAGLGQCAIIISARLHLIRVPARARVFELGYEALTPFLRDQSLTGKSERFEYVDGTIVAEAPGRHRYKLTVAKLYESDQAPDNTALLKGLEFSSGAEPTLEVSYAAFARRVDEYVKIYKAKGYWDKPHPWLDVLLPASHTERIIAETLDELADENDGMILTYVLRRSRCHTPLLALPDEEWIYLFDVLRNASPPTPERVELLLQRNKELLRKCVAVGGGVYPIGAVSLSPAEWRVQYRHWQRLAEAKRRFDPHQVLTPGHGLFERELAAG